MYICVCVFFKKKNNNIFYLKKNIWHKINLKNIPQQESVVVMYPDKRETLLKKNTKKNIKNLYDTRSTNKVYSAFQCRFYKSILGVILLRIFCKLLKILHLKISLNVVTNIHLDVYI